VLLTVSDLKQHILAESKTVLNETELNVHRPKGRQWGFWALVQFIAFCLKFKSHSWLLCALLYVWLL